MINFGVNFIVMIVFINDEKIVYRRNFWHVVRMGTLVRVLWIDSLFVIFMYIGRYLVCLLERACF